MPEDENLNHLQRLTLGKPNRVDLLLTVLEQATPEEEAAHFASLADDERYSALAMHHELGGEADAVVAFVRLVHRFPAMADRAVKALHDLAERNQPSVGFRDSADDLERSIEEAREIGLLGVEPPKVGEAQPLRTTGGEGAGRRG